MPKKSRDKKEKLPSVNQMVKNIKGALHDAGVDSKYIAAEVVRIYSDNGYPVKVPLISEIPNLWDCTSIAKELGIMSNSGRPHDKAVSGIIQQLDLFRDEVIRTAFSRNGPSTIEYRLSSGRTNKCKVFYQEVA